MKADRKPLAVLFLDISVCGLFFVVPILAQWMSKTLPACIFWENGILCPGCGATRCIRDIRLGAFASAFRQNPFVFIMVLYLAGCILLLNLGYLFNFGFAKKMAAAGMHYKTVIGIMVCFAAFGILRNFV